MDQVPANQTVSFGIYSQTIQNACPFPHDFFRANAARIQRAYDHGEPLWMIIDELKLVHSMRRPAPTKTPRQLAAKVVRI